MTAPFLPPTSSLLPRDQAIIVRYPEIITSQAYLNNPFTFTSDERFDAESVLLDAGNVSIIQRDNMDYLIVDIGLPMPQSYPIPTYSDSYTSASFNAVFDTTFTYFI